MAEQANADTSSQDNTQGNTPPAGQDTSAQSNQGGNTPEVVTLTKEQHDEMLRNIATGKTAQRDLARYQRVFGKDIKKPHFTSEPQAPAQENNEGTNQAVSTAPEPGVEEDRKAERLLMGVVLDPKYREVLDADPTLRVLLTHNPLGVLPILAPDALNAEDAEALVREKLDDRVLELNKKSSEGTTSTTDESKTDKATPPTGAINTTTADVDAEIEAAKKNPNTEQAIAGMIRGGMKKMGSK